MARPMNAPTPNHNLSWKSVTQLNPINPGAFIQLLVLDIFQIYLIFSLPSIRASNVMFQVKHQRAFHRLLLSLAIMDNIYLVHLTVHQIWISLGLFALDFIILTCLFLTRYSALDFIILTSLSFWQDCLCSHLLPCKPESGL